MTFGRHFHDDLDIEGTRRDDTIVGTRRDDEINAKKGNDTVFAGKGDDEVKGDKGNDRLYGERGDDKLDGGDGDDELHGGEGRDRLDGGDGDDLLHGEDGKDILIGGDGSDCLFGGANDDVLIGDSHGSDFGLGFLVKLIFDWLWGWDGHDQGTFDDKLEGGAGEDLLIGGKGDDTLDGGDDDDELYGGDGNDTLTGGSGNDQLDGDKGHDCAVFSGNFADYEIEVRDHQHSKKVIVTDLRDGSPDGTDTLKGVEVLKFADLTIAVEDLGQNASPVAVDDSFATDEDTAIIGGVFDDNGLGADFDIDGDAFDIVAVDGDPLKVGVQVALISGALLTLNGDGSFDYDPNGHFEYLVGGESETDSFSYTIADGVGGSSTATVTLIIDGLNDAPTAEDVSGSVSEDGPAVVLGFVGDDVDSDDDGTTLTYTIVSTPSVGSVMNNGDGTFSFDPEGDFQDLEASETEEVTFTYRATDGHGAMSAPATVTVTVEGADDGPPPGPDLDIFVVIRNLTQSIRVFLNQDGEMAGSFVDSGQAPFDDRSNSDVALGDLDGDGDLDAFIARVGLLHETVWVNQGGAQGGTPGLFQDSGQELGAMQGTSVALGDLDGDGDLDAFVGNTAGGSSDLGDRIWINQGGAQGGAQGQFQDSGQVLGNVGTNEIALGDVDGDGDLDAFAATSGTSPDILWINQGGAQGGTESLFVDSGQVFPASDSVDIAFGDLDGDGDLDAYAAVTGLDLVRINQGGAQGGIPGVFQDSGQALSANLSGAVALGDLDGDGDLDALVGGAGLPSGIWLNQGGAQGGIAGTLADSGQQLFAGSVTSAALGDLDGDGDLDAVMVASGTDRVWINQGGAQGGTPGTFPTVGVQLSSSDISFGVALGDLDGDGVPANGLPIIPGLPNPSQVTLGSPLTLHAVLDGGAANLLDAGAGAVAPDPVVFDSLGPVGPDLPGDEEILIMA